MNNLPEARKVAIKAHEIEANNPKTDLLFMDIAWEEGRDGEVIKRANSVISGTGDKHILYDAYFFLSKVYKKQKKYDLAKDIYLKIIEMFPKGACNTDAYAAFLESQGRRDEAIAYGEKAVSIMSFPVARKRLGILYYKKVSDILWTKQQPDKAIQLFLASAEHHPTANAYYGLGTSYALAGRKVRDLSMMEKAGDALEKSLEMDPGHELAKKQLADVRKVIQYEQQE